jgi:quercetin dioxygenase-like cupin family protein
MMQQTAEETNWQASIREAEAFKSPYERWKEAEGISTIRGLAVSNLLDVELTPWKARGGAAIFVNLHGTGGFNDTYVYELAPRESSVPVKHIYEETVFILKGVGATTIWIDEKKKQTFEWHDRSYFAIPPNAWYQHHNLSGSEPMRYVAMTAAPRVIDTFKSTDFVFNNPYVFEDRFNGEDGYFQESERHAGRGPWRTNFVSDVLAVTPTPGSVVSEGRGGGTVSTVFTMVNSTVRSHSQAWPVATHSKFHRHGPGIHVVLLRGRGYSLMGEDMQSVERVDWGPGSMFVPPEGWWHAHYNIGPDPALFLAIGWGSDKPKAGGKQYVYKSVKDGGDQYEFEDEDPGIHAQFEAELAKYGVTCAMGPIHPYCTQR